ncbi:MGMT family protein [Sedimenticola thiotaurini]|uniref:MGMT family protein n=1 Tax=Sedimenticola thiotaurini TaxID=1543721 RepID=UPI002FF79D83
MNNYQRIWRTVLAIPAGRVASYGQIADLAGLPGRARLVGRALGQVPETMSVPWYRVLRSDGRIAFPAGSPQAERQKGHLQEEGVIVLNNRVRLKAFGWQPDLAELLMRLEF